MEDKFTNINDELLAAFLDGNANAEEINRILSTFDEDKELVEIMSLSEAIDYGVEDEELRVIPMKALVAANKDNLCSFECEVYILQRLDCDVDHWTLLETAKVNNWLREEGTPMLHVGRLLELKGLYVERRYDSSHPDLAKALEHRNEVIAIVDRKIFEESDHSTPPLIHAVYVTGIESDGTVRCLDLDTMNEKRVRKDDFLKAWECSGNYMVTATRTPADYNPQPIKVEDIALDGDLEELTEAIAENAHDIWARARMDEGWRYGSVRDDQKKLHPDLVPYSRLSEGEKEYDRLMAMNTLRLVRRLGFRMFKQNEK